MAALPTALMRCDAPSLSFPRARAHTETRLSLTYSPGDCYSPSPVLQMLNKMSKNTANFTYPEHTHARFSAVLHCGGTTTKSQFIYTSKKKAKCEVALRYLSKMHPQINLDAYLIVHPSRVTPLTTPYSTSAPSPPPRQSSSLVPHRTLHRVESTQFPQTASTTLDIKEVLSTFQQLQLQVDQLLVDLVLVCEERDILRAYFNLHHVG